MSPRGPRQLLQGVGIALAAWAVLALLHGFGVFRIPDLKLLDFAYLIRGERAASERIALVEVDDATIAEYGQWPLPRETYAVLIAALEEAGVRTIGLDLLFLGEDEDDPQGDALLAAVTSLQRNVAHAVAFVPEDPAQGGGAATAPFQQALLMEHGLPFDGQWPAAAVRVSLPYDALLAATPGLGHVSVAVDPDGVVRRVPQFVRYGDRVYPSLAFRVAMGARPDTSLPTLVVEDGGVTVHWAQDGRMRVPVDGEGATAIDFAGDRGAFARRHSMIEVLRRYRDGDMQPLREAFADRLVLVGTTAVSEHATDIGPTPFSEATPLVFIHANAVNAVLEGRFLKPAPAALALPLLALIAALLGWLFMTLPTPRGVATMLGATLLAGAALYLLFAFGGLTAPATVALALPPLAWGGTEVFRRLLLDRATQARERELQVAREIQRHLLPSAPPQVAGYDVWGLNIPAQEVGGDYYDWTILGADRLAVCVGDVSGKGVAAALLMSHLRASFHAEVRAGESPRAVVTAMHASLYHATDPGRFATFFLALFPRGGGPLRYCNAGHNPVLLVRGGALTLIESTGLPLAMVEGMPYEEGEAPFEPGDVLVMYSDGITEAEHGGDMYGDERLRERVPRLVARDLDARGIAEGVLEDVRAFTRDHLEADDVTLVVVRRA